MTLDQAADHYRAAVETFSDACLARARAHDAHIATIPLLGRVRVGNGSDPTRRAHHDACQAAVDARTHLERASDQLVTAALDHTCRP